MDEAYLDPHNIVLSESIETLMNDTINKVKMIDKLIVDHKLINEQFTLNYLDELNKYSVKY